MFLMVWTMPASDVKIAKNNLLPDLNFSGSVTMDTNPNKPSTVEYNTERTTWRGLVEFEVPLNRQVERNEFRSSLIDLRRAERNYDESHDRVPGRGPPGPSGKSTLAKLSLEIQKENIAVGEVRAAQANALDELGKLSSNRDVIEAENALRDARNSYAEALADFRRTILEFLLSTGTLRVGDDGQWVTHDADAMPATSSGPRG